MKLRIVLLMLLAVVVNNNAAQELVVKPAINNVKVFLRGAELEYNFKTKLQKGIRDIVITGLANNIDQNSINISAKGDLIILSVGQRYDYLNTPEKNPQIKSLQDSLEILQKDLAFQNGEADAVNSELNLLYANQKIGTDQRGATISEIQKMAEFFRKRISELKVEIFKISVKVKKLQKSIERVNNQLTELNNEFSKPVNQIVLSVNANSDTNADINLSYLIYDAGWIPSYDIRVDNLSSPAKLFYKANVWQNSLIDWNNVQIILSTRNAIRNNDKPELSPWFIDFQRAILFKEKRELSAPSVAAMNIQEDKMIEAGSMADYFVANEKQLSVEFVPQIKYSILSDSKQHSVALQDYSIPAEYRYYAVPKLAENAFLIAKLTDWAQYNLLSGEANIYFENTYIGKTSLMPNTMKDTLEISLGRDENIIVSRETLKDFTEDKFLSSDIERTFAYEIKVKNNKKNTINLIVEDQFPLSQNEDIEVKLIDASGASQLENGILNWNITVESGKTISKKLTYSVRHPKDKNVNGL